MRQRGPQFSSRQMLGVLASRGNTTTDTLLNEFAESLIVPDANLKRRTRNSSAIGSRKDAIRSKNVEKTYACFTDDAFSFH